jgi:hypothetical protein
MCCISSSTVLFHMLYHTYFEIYVSYTKSLSVYCTSIWRINFFSFSSITACYRTNVRNIEALFLFLQGQVTVMIIDHYFSNECQNLSSFAGYIVAPSDCKLQETFIQHFLGE